VILGGFMGCRRAGSLSWLGFSIVWLGFGLVAWLRC
jgi:hypothetical protein